MHPGMTPMHPSMTPAHPGSATPMRDNPWNPMSQPTPRHPSQVCVLSPLWRHSDHRQASSVTSWAGMVLWLSFILLVLIQARQ
jgi:hypothetical protein